MELALFDFITDTIQYYNMHKAGYEYVLGQVENCFRELVKDDGEAVVSLHSRLKSEKSLKEKLIRNHFYLDYKDGEDAISHLSDLIGITIECRFIRNENEIYQKLLRHFIRSDEGWAVCREFEAMHLNTHMPQPQYQRNGFTIYRIDGYYVFNDAKVNFELQIKSMVHNFWSDIEHKIVYKNPDFAVYDRFNKSMLGAIRDNLDVVDHQLEIMFDEISDTSENRQIGMDEKGFKVFCAQSINELMNKKMAECFGFTTDFKKCSAILAQYIYLRDFINGEHNREQMVDYLEHLNYLSDTPMDLKEEVHLERKFEGRDIFCQKLGSYWEEVMNIDFQWHIFFVMLFAIQGGERADDLNDFVNVIEILVAQPGWFMNTFRRYSDEERKDVRNTLLSSLADAMIDAKKIEMVHEDRLHRIMGVFRRYVEFLEEKYDTYKSFQDQEEEICAALSYQISNVFKSE